MKKLAKILAVVAAVVLCFAALCACTEKPEDKVVTIENLEVGSDEVALILQESATEYTIKVAKLADLGENANAEALINYFANKNEIKITWQDSEYGKYITSYSNKTLAEGEFVSVYTSVAADKGDASYAKNVKLGNYTVTTSAVGVTSAKVEGGAVIYLQIESYTAA